MKNPAPMFPLADPAWREFALGMGYDPDTGDHLPDPVVVELRAQILELQSDRDELAQQVLDSGARFQAERDRWQRWYAELVKRYNGFASAKNVGRPGSEVHGLLREFDRQLRKPPSATMPE